MNVFFFFLHSFCQFISQMKRYVVNLYSSGLKLNLPGGRWKQFLGATGPHGALC